MPISDNVHVNVIISAIYSHSPNKTAYTISAGIPPYILHWHPTKEIYVKQFFDG